MAGTPARELALNRAITTAPHRHNVYHTMQSFSYRMVNTLA